MPVLEKTSPYNPLLDLRQTEQAIRVIKEFFQINLAQSLNLSRVSAPLFVLGGTGINDDLNGTEKPISFFTSGGWPENCRSQSAEGSASRASACYSCASFTSAKCNPAYGRRK